MYYEIYNDKFQIVFIEGFECKNGITKFTPMSSLVNNS